MGTIDAVRNKAIQYADKMVLDGHLASSGSAFAGKLSQIKTGFSKRVYKKRQKGEVPIEGPISVGKEKAKKVGEKFKRLISSSKYDATDLPKELRNKYPEVELLKYVTTPGFRRGGIDGYGKIGDKEYIVDIFDEIPELSDLMDKIGPKVEDFYSSPVRLLTTSIRRTEHVPEEIMEKSEVYSNYWHVDGHPVSHVRVLVAIDDIGEENGPFHYLGYDDSRRVLDENFNRNQSGIPGSNIEKEYHVKKFTGTPGDLVICNTNVILHRAGNPAPGKKRDMMLLTFAPVRDKTDMSWREQSTYGLVRGTEDLWNRLNW